VDFRHGFPGGLQEWRTRMRLFSGGSSLVAVVQAADLGHRDDRPDFWPRNGSWLGRVLPQGEMRSGSVIVSERSILRTLSLCHQHLLTGLQARFSNRRGRAGWKVHDIAGCSLIGVAPLVPHP